MPRQERIAGQVDAALSFVRLNQAFFASLLTDDHEESLKAATRKNGRANEILLLFETKPFLPRCNTTVHHTTRGAKRDKLAIQITTDWLYK